MTTSTNEIISQNEIAYKNKYDISLRERWSRHAIGICNDSLAYIENTIKDETIKSWNFKPEEILRVIIGYMSKSTLENALSNASPVARVLLWEPDESLFEAGCVKEDLSDLINDNRLFIVIGSDSEDIRKGIENVLFENNIRHQMIVVYGRYLAPKNESVEMFRDMFGQIAGEIQTKMNLRKQYEELPYKNMLFAVNQLSNNSTSGQLFDSIPTRDIPVIIVAAGPSLMKNCKELKRAEGRAVIVAVARAMSTLVKNGVDPDLVAVTDPNSPFFLDFDTEKKHILLSCIYANRLFQETYNGQLIYYGLPMFRECFSCERAEKESGECSDTGSVATDIFALFAKEGFKKFILVGQDLAFDDKGFSHTEGEKEEDIYRVMDAEGINGNIVKVRGDWDMFRKFYEKKIEENSELEVIDATEGGALIHGSRVMTLADAIEQNCQTEYQVNEWTGSLKKGDKEEKDLIDDWFNMQNDMCIRMEKNLKEIISLNENIRSIWSRPDQWDDEFGEKCKKYDVMYNVIMEGSAGTLLRAYCSSDLERYIEDAFTLEGDDNVEKRMYNEYELFKLMKQKLDDMNSYIKEIRC